MTQRTLKLDEDLFLELQRQILSGETPPGTRLPPERELAASFGTNRNTLREAIRRLEQARLVSVRQGQGVTVRDFRRSATIEILEAFLAHAPDPIEKTRCLADLLSARVTVLEYILSLAIERATSDDLRRLAGVTELLLTAFESRDRQALSGGYLQWLDALIEAAHSLPARWVANPFLDVNRSITARFPALWVLDDGFPAYLRASCDAIVATDLTRAIATHRAYYERIDRTIMAGLSMMIASGSIGIDPAGAPSVRRRLGTREI